MKTMDLPRHAELGKLEDVDLVLYIMFGYKDLYGELVRRYQDKIYTVMLHRLGNTEDALDAAQEVFVRAYRNIETFKGHSAFFSWLYRIAVNTSIDYRRKNLKRKTQNISMDELESEIGYEPPCNATWSSPEKSYRRKELKTAIERAIGRLSENLKGAFVLHDVLGYSQEQTAEYLQIPQGTVKSRVSRARQLMREHLSDVI